MKDKSQSLRFKRRNFGGEIYYNMLTDRGIFNHTGQGCAVTPSNQSETNCLCCHLMLTYDCDLDLIESILPFLG